MHLACITRIQTASHPQTHSKMTAAANIKSSSAMSARRPATYALGSPDSTAAGQRMFKKHKVLPHPKRQRSGNAQSYEVRPTRKTHVDTAPSQIDAPQHPQTLRHQSRRISSGPDLPPTPPSHSRTSSSTNSIPPPSSPTLDEAVSQTPTTPARGPTTPPNQKSPPTPDVTPPQPAIRPKAVRPIPLDRTVSKATTAESRAESFRTAREDPYSSGDDDMQSTVRPNVLSARTSQNTVRRVSEQSQTKTPTPVGLGSGLESPKDDVPIPRTKGDFGTFDGEWASNSEEVEQEWDDNLGRTVTVRKRRQPADKKTGTPPLRRGRRKVEIIEDRVVTPTNATKALRAMAHRDRAAFYAPSEIAWASHSNTGSSANDSRRCSGMSAKSTKSNASTVVEAILVDAPSIPQRRQTLRHVRKHVALRDSGSDRSPSSSVTNSYVKSEDSPRRPRPLARPTDSRHNSYASNTTSNSMSSGRARREVWKNGGIPVIVVPDRRSSVKSKSSREPSLRSTSSRRSKRSASLSSATRANGSKTHDLSTPIFDRPGRRSRTMSESDGSSQRTIDYPPVIPRRSSSLSAPTSRNTSRAGSLTAESLKSRNALLNQSSGHETRPPPVLTLQRAASSETDNGHHHRDHKLNVDRHGDPFFGKRLDTHNTPFSAASVETNGTAPEVSEAKAVNLYPHQNSSVLVVNHSNKPSESSEASQTELSKTPQRPTITTTAPDGEGPVTPPQGLHSMDDVDSPLRNPRAAPPVPPVIPPAIQFIPATPSGLTPHHERQKTMGNYFETMTDDQPHRSGSILRRALSRRRNSETYPPRSARPGLLTRTLSLTRRGSSSGSSHKADAALETPCTCPECEAPPPEDDRLHPHWRPAYSDPEDDMWEREMQDEPISKVYRYAPLDDRPQGPRRSISARMKKTFAILPSRGDGLAYSPPVQDEPERRTIRRTDSGSLRVMRRRSSLDSLRDQSYNERPRASRYDEEGGQEEQGGQEEAGPRRRRRFSMSGTLEGLQNIPRQFNERKREKRTQELRQKISGPREVRDGVGDVIRRNTYRDAYHRAQTASINF